MTNLNALIAEVGTICRTPGADQAAALHVLYRVDRGWLTTTEARTLLEMLGLIKDRTET
jgi:hypothetical protein